MQNFLNKLREDSRFLLYVMIVIAVLFLAFFAFWAGLVVLFFVGVLVWIAFVLFYLRFLFGYSFVFRTAVFTILLALTVYLFYRALTGL